MNLLKIGKAVIENFFFMQALTRHIGEPVNLTNEEANKVYEDLKTDKLMQQKFALALNIKTLKIEFHHNMEKFMAFNGSFDLDKFFHNVHPDVLADFLKWGKSIYSLMMDREIPIEPLRLSARMTIPLKLYDGHYHWVLQEAIPIQLDANQKVVVHLNIYTVLRLMDKDENVELVSRIYNDGIEMHEITQDVWKDYFTRQTFDLTPVEMQIVALLAENIELSNSEVADILAKQKNTIDAHNKHIIAKARNAYKRSSDDFGNIKDVVKFLKEIGYI